MLKRLKLGMAAVMFATLAALVAVPAYAVEPANPTPAHAAAAKRADPALGEAGVARVNPADLARAVGPQTADCISLCYLQATNTTNCLTSDYSNTYTAHCFLGGGRWYFQGLSDNTWQLRAENTGLCLSNFNYVAVFTTSCNSSSAGQHWNLYWHNTTDAFRVQNAGTGGYLATDYSNTVYLSSNVVEWNSLF
jgi:hypothetical protein